MAWLAEAHLMDGRPERARELAERALTLAEATKQGYGVGVAQRVLGRGARSPGDARSYLDAALATFTAIEAQFETGRTRLDLAVLARDSGDTVAVARHLREAHRLFAVLAVPRFVERTEEVARTLGVAVT